MSRDQKQANVPGRTIKAVFDEFLDEQRVRISERTLRDYEGAIYLLQTYLENYWPGHPDESAGGSLKYCESFGPEELPHVYDEFLGYFLPRKVLCGRGTLKTAAAVLKRLGKWLVGKGYVDAERAEYAVGLAKAATRDLPASAEALDILSTCCEDASRGRFGERLEDHFTITRVEPGRLWLAPLLGGGEARGPVPVPEEATALLKEGWDLGGILAKTPRGWRLFDVWNLSP